jgi:hypothetical protein
MTTPFTSSFRELIPNPNIERFIFPRFIFPQLPLDPYRYYFPEIGTLKEIIKLSGLQIERITARVIETSTIVNVSSEDLYRLDFKKLERDDVYYLFSLGRDTFLAKRDRNVVRVFEVFRDGDKMLALPIYDVEVSGFER